MGQECYEPSMVRSLLSTGPTTDFRRTFCDTSRLEVMERGSFSLFPPVHHCPPPVLVPLYPYSIITFTRYPFLLD